MSDYYSSYIWNNMKLNEQEVNKLLDDYNITNELLQEQIASNSIAGHTITHIKRMLHKVLEDMKTKEYKPIKKSIQEIYDILAL